MPLLAERILKHNNEVKLRQQRAAGDAGDAGVTGPGDASVTEAGVTRRHYLVNLVGYVVGNGVTDDEVDGNAQVGDRVTPAGCLLNICELIFCDPTQPRLGFSPLEQARFHVSGAWHLLAATHPAPSPSHASQPWTHTHNRQVPYAWGAGLLDKDTHTFVTNACEANFWNATKGAWFKPVLLEQLVGYWPHVP